MSTTPRFGLGALVKHRDLVAAAWSPTTTATSCCSAAAAAASAVVFLLVDPAVTMERLSYLAGLHQVYGGEGHTLSLPLGSIRQPASRG